MLSYDAALKLLLTQSAAVTIRTVSGLQVKRWPNVEISSVKQSRVDLLGESPDGRLLQIEFQSRNDRTMWERMLKYGVAVLDKYGRYPKQVVLYVGKDRLRMEGTYRVNEEFTFRYGIVDIRKLDAKKLLKSSGIGDNVLAILAAHGGDRQAVREIIGRIAKLAEPARLSRMEQLIVLAGLRQLGPIVREEASQMPITEDILDHEIIGTAYKKGRRAGRKQGRQEGREEGLQEGQQKGELKILQRQIERRFGAVPEWLDQRLAQSTAQELEEIGVRLLDARTPEDLLKK